MTFASSSMASAWLWGSSLNSCRLFIEVLRDFDLGIHFRRGFVGIEGVVECTAVGGYLVGGDG